MRVCKYNEKILNSITWSGQETKNNRIGRQEYVERKRITNRASGRRSSSIGATFQRTTTTSPFIITDLGRPLDSQPLLLLQNSVALPHLSFLSPQTMSPLPPLYVLFILIFACTTLVFFHLHVLPFLQALDANQKVTIMSTITSICPLNLLWSQ